jgi:hypothetical protein
MAYLQVPVKYSIHRPKLGVGLYASIYGSSGWRVRERELLETSLLVGCGALCASVGVGVGERDEGCSVSQ